jgi:Tfp pilus assembly protein PilO
MVFIFLLLCIIVGSIIGIKYLFTLKIKNEELEVWMEYHKNKFELLKVRFNEKCIEVEELEKINYDLKEKLKDDNKRLQGIIKRKSRVLKRIQKLKLVKKEKDIIIEYFLKPKNYQ